MLISPFVATVSHLFMLFHDSYDCNSVIRIRSDTFAKRETECILLKIMYDSKIYWEHSFKNALPKILCDLIKS